MNKFSFETDGYPERGQRSVQSVAAVYDRRRKAKMGCLSHGGHRPPLQRKTQILLTALLGLIGPICLPVCAQTAPNDSVEPMAKVTLHIGKASLTTEIAASAAQEERGLMFRPKMADNDGMIFLLPKVTTATFWMKNTLIPLSIAFIDKNGMILEIHDMKALDETITRSDSDRVAYALETNLHWFALNGIKPGDKIDPAPGTLGKPIP